MTRRALGAALLLAAATVASSAGCLRREASSGALTVCRGLDRPLVAVVDGGIETVGPLQGRSIRRRDVVAPSTAPLDPHGTAMAAIIAERRPDARLLDVRALGPGGRGSVAGLVRGIDAARRADADTILLSLALPADPAVDAAIVAAADDGAVVVVAAGNDGVDLDLQPRWRSLAAHDRVVVVGAEDDDGRPLAGSNRGRTTVEQRADGEGVATSGPAGEAIRIDGTSPAAAAVAARC